MRTDRPIHLIGAGGHGLVVIDALLASGVAMERLRVFDGREDKIGTSHFGLTVERFIPADATGWLFHPCIGANETRLALAAVLEAQGCEALSIAHPAAVVSPQASMSPGCFVAARAVVGPFASIGHVSIVNHGAVVDHECEVGEGCHIAPGAILGGAVAVERLAMIGAGATILPRVKVGAGATIGAGAVVVRDVQGGAVQVGVPARNLPES